MELHYHIRLWVSGYNQGNTFSIQFVSGPILTAPTRLIGLQAPQLPQLPPTMYLPSSLSDTPGPSPEATNPSLSVILLPPLDTFLPLDIAHQFSILAPQTQLLTTGYVSHLDYPSIRAPL